MAAGPMTLVRRVWEHKAKVAPGFTAKHGVGSIYPALN
jgi:predicted GIY-YIG superfamily endonuclease